MIDLSKLSALLEKRIQPYVAQNLSQKTLFYNFTQKSTKKPNLVGTTVFYPVRVGRVANFYGVPDSETTVGRGEPDYRQAQFSVKLYAGSIEFTKKALSVPDPEQVVDHLTQITNDLIQDAQWILNYEFITKENAEIGTAATAGSSTTSLTFKPYTVGGTDNGDITAQDLIAPGDYIKIGTNPAVQVVAVNGNSVTLASAQTWSAGASIKRATVNGNVEDSMPGLLSIVDDTDFAGLTVASVPAWQAYKDVPASATVLALNDLYKAFSTINKLGDVDYIFMNRTLFNKYGSILQAQVRFTPTQKLSAGWVGLEFMGGNAQVILDYHIPSDAVYFISSKNLHRIEIEAPHFEKGTDGNLLRNYGGLKYEAVLTALLTLACDVRGAHGVVGNRTA
jgi:archaellum component FlaF (FlaF/FlaG flagellin family)